MAAFIDQKYSKNCQILLQYKIAVFYVNIMNFSIITPVFTLQCHMILQKSL